MNATPSLEKYNQLLAPARERFETSPGLNALRSTNDPRFLEAFLLYFCAIGAQMTEPVERWIGRWPIAVRWPLTSQNLLKH